MIYLLDTNVLGDIARSDARVVGRFRGLPAADRTVIRATVRGEVLFGLSRMATGRRKVQVTADMHGLLTKLDCEPVTAAVADQ